MRLWVCFTEDVLILLVKRAERLVNQLHNADCFLLTRSNTNHTKDGLISTLHNKLLSLLRLYTSTAWYSTDLLGFDRHCQHVVRAKTSLLVVLLVESIVGIAV